MKETNRTDLNILFESFKNGNNEAFETIYNELKHPVFVIAFRIVLNYELAEDITQEVFVKLYTSSFNHSVSNFRAYVFQMGRNLAIDALRKKNGSFINIDDVGVSTDGEIEEFILRNDVEKAMLKLTVGEREIVTLKINGDLTFSQISKIVKLSLPRVYRKYSKAIKTLRDELNGDAL